jgi:hypothetical protein
VDDARVTESCAQCSAPLADDQRYCLQCGEPRPHVSGPLSTKSVTEKPPQTPPMLSDSSPALPGIAGTPPSGRNNSLALIAGVGVLLLAMGVGVLIGRAGSGSAKAPPAQVISLGAAGGAAGAAVTPTTTTPAVPIPSSTAKKAAKAKEPAGAGSSITKPAPPSAAQNLRSGGTGQSYEQKSKNLPNVVSTG